jgi:putative ABC transport system permease protein
MSAFWKDLFREIKNTPGRFLSLLIITALGASSVVGIQAASIDMRAIADKTYKEHNLYDLQIKSTMGFDDDDIAALIDAEGVSAVMPTTIYDVYVNIENENRAVRTYAMPDEVNTVVLLTGRFPLTSDECVVESRVLDEGNISIGDNIRLGLDDMEDYYDVFAGDTFTVVGVVESSLYITFERGKTSLGDGSLRYYLYLHPDAYTLDVYTDVYLLMDGSHDIDNLTDGYYSAADGWKSRIEQAGLKQVQAKKDDLADAQRKIDEGWDEYFNGVRELDEKTADARRELEDANTELADAKIELENGQDALDEKIVDGLSEIDKQYTELINGQKELDTLRDEIEAGQVQIFDARSQLEQSLAELALMGPQGVSPELDAHYEQVYASLEQLEYKQAEINEGLTALATAQIKVDDGVRQIKEARITLEDERIKAQAGINDGWVKYYEGLDEYNEGVLTLETEEADALVELADAKRELEEAQEELDDAPTPEWFYFTRKDGLSFDSYYQDTLRLQKIGYVFPLMFFLVAILVSLTSMSRMVEEHRIQIGIYKALGFRPAAIMAKYLVYAFSASIVGAIGGVAFGSRLFPYIISDAYGHLYDFPPVEMPIPALIAVIAVIFAVLSVMMVTFCTCVKSMTGTPALLMRPKAPAKGKRVWLEKISVMWNRLGFFSKVTARNVFRYKRRFVMTLVGVAGCSALLITAFGLRDSIGVVGDLQYENIVEYDARAYLKDISTDDQRNELNALLPDNHLYIREESLTASGASGSLPASLVIPEAPEMLNDYYNLYSPESKEPVIMTAESVLITGKLARVMGVKIGEVVTLTLSDGSVHHTKVTGIVDNYIQHFIYMSPAVYSELFDKEPYANSVMIYYDNGREFAAPLLENSYVRALIHNDEIKSQVGDQTDAMRIVAYVLIVLACALALVVLFNLSNINISERTRELATIKVLGFFDSELSMYVFRETGIVVVLGIVLGLIGGVFLHSFVLTTIEIDILKFPQVIFPMSYTISIVLTIAFSIFVSLAMKYKLARIGMVESLKNVE